MQVSPLTNRQPASLRRRQSHPSKSGVLGCVIPPPLFVIDLGRKYLIQLPILLGPLKQQFYAQNS